MSYDRHSLLSLTGCAESPDASLLAPTRNGIGAQSWSKEMKPFSGVLRSWMYETDTKCIMARIVWHVRHNPALSDEFQPDHRIRTSKMVSMVPWEGSNFTLLETENSFYVLLGGGRNA